MKKRSKLIFFSLLFLASLLAELYCIVILKENIFIIAGMGIIVLTNGYLMMERFHQAENQKWTDRYTEILELHKSSDTELKKIYSHVNEKIDKLQNKLTILEDGQKKIIELEKKAMEGIKKSVNINVAYGNENTKELLEKLEELRQTLNKDEFLTDIINELKSIPFLGEEKVSQPDDTMLSEEKDDQTEDLELSNEVLLSHDDVKDENEVEIKPLYDDPNKNLTVGEIAALFQAYGK